MTTPCTESIFACLPPSDCRGRAVATRVLVALACLLFSPLAGYGQEAAEDTEAVTTKPAAAAKNAPAQEPRKVPPPRNVSLETKDGVRLGATYYAGTLKKESVPVICLHGYRGDRSVYESLAEYLQSVGHAVIVPDLRGHGASTKRADGATLDAARLKPGDLRSMVNFDVERVKRFLMEENNKGELNIDKLCVIGSDMGATVAINWAMADGRYPPLGRVKQGQDVKALVLISPLWSFKGININEAMANEYVQRELSILLIVGKEHAKSYSEANRVFRSFQRFHPEPLAEEVATKKDLFIYAPLTKLQGTKLLGENLNLEEYIQRFITVRLTNREFPWQDRKSPIE